MRIAVQVTSNQVNLVKTSQNLIMDHFTTKQYLNLAFLQNSGKE